MAWLGFACLATGLALALYGAHLGRARPWDRPRFTHGTRWRVWFAAASAALLAAGIVLLAAASPGTAGGALAGLAALGAWRAWASRPATLEQRVLEDLARRGRDHAAAEPRERLRLAIGARHPEWGEDLVRQLVEDAPDERTLARTIVRMERIWRR